MVLETIAVGYKMTMLPSAVKRLADNFTKIRLQPPKGPESG